MTATPIRHQELSFRLEDWRSGFAPTTKGRGGRADVRMNEGRLGAEFGRLFRRRKQSHYADGAAKIWKTDVIAQVSNLQRLRRLRCPANRQPKSGSLAERSGYRLRIGGSLECGGMLAQVYRG